MRFWTTRRALVALLAITVSVGSVGSADAQFFGGSGDREETRPSQSQQERPGVSERLRQWFEGEREARRQRLSDQEQMQAQRERRRAGLRILYAAYVAGYMDGYQDAIDDHITLMLDKQDRQGGPPRMAPDQRGLSPRDREQFRRNLRERIRSQMQQPRSEARRPTGATSQQIAGEILRTKRVELKNTRQEHLVALVESDQGQRRIVDLGPAKNLKDLDLSRGDRISIQGKTGRAAGNVPVVLAQRLKAGDQQITIQRKPPKQEKSQPKQDEKKRDEKKQQEKK